MSLLAGRRVLILEDEPVVAFALEDMLIDMGCVVVGPALRLPDAFALIESTPFDAAILDVNISGVPSYPIADELERRGIPYLFATGYGKDGVEARRVRVGVLTKPYRPHQVESALLDCWSGDA
jgi:CheY-like chemotaxis protein